jgi:L-malate glycosyltransferase
MAMNVMFLASWYPTIEDNTKGIFIYRQAKILSCDNVIHAFHLTENKMLDRYCKIEFKKISDNYNEVYLYYNTSNRFLRFFIFIRFNFYCLGYYLRNDIEIMHLNVLYPMNVILYPFLLIVRCPIFISEHWSGYFKEDGRFYKLNFVARNIILQLLKRAYRIYVVSKSLKIQIDSLIGLSTKQSIILFNTLRVPANIEYRRNLIKSEIRILVIATMEEHSKNILGILKAFDEVLRFRSNIRLIIVGDGADLIRIKNYQSSNENWDMKVSFEGRVSSEKVLDYYKTCHFYVINSNFETFSISTAEALLHGIPVIATNCYGPTEYINLSNGIIIERKNIAQLVLALNYMIENWHNYDSHRIQRNMKLYYSKHKLDSLTFYS